MSGMPGTGARGSEPRILEANAVSVRYPGTGALAVDRASCGVRAGELVAVVGPNGSGKTTLVRALLGVAPLEAGRALVQGRDVREWARPALARTVGVVTQREETFLPLRVHESVMLGRYPHLGAFAAETAADRAAVRAALERCDVWQFRDRRIDTLSGGEWQRVRVARALAQEPRALVLDEPTAALDVRHEMELFELFRRLATAGLAALVVTHQLNLAARYADRVVLMSAGRVVADGEPALVFDRGILSQVFQWPVAVTTWCDGAPQVVPLRVGEEPAP
ncbi:MAG TPA: ABC transporter ATP-binding protein [Gemmatimonadales bacterium]|nr:ABC transporter ATP-binding protein [Gemmatimonadales bacterium]